MLQRKITKYLETWLTQKYALLVDGARQVGKTFILKEFARTHFKNVVYINLFENKFSTNAIKGSKNA